jgi:hypothetical protein
VGACRFRTRLFRPAGVGTWTLAPFPRKVAEVGGFRAHQRVRGTIERAPFRLSLVSAGGGKLCVVVKSEIRQVIGKTAGDSVQVSLEPDLSPVRISVPVDLDRALRRNPVVADRFLGLAPSHRRAFVEWIGSAKRAETRGRRIGRTVQMLQKGKTLKGGSRGTRP